ncbi:MAG TPA: hypothetical protein VF062_28210 [Candidatus Limnocylindrales bacterium]
MDRRLVSLIAAAVAVAAIAAGLLAGMSGVQALGVDCGSAFSPDGESALVEDLTDAMLGGESGAATQAACADAIGSRRGLAITLLVVGGLAALVALLATRKPRPPARRQEPTAGTGSDDSRNMDTPR